MLQGDRILGLSLNMSKLRGKERIHKVSPRLSGRAFELYKVARLIANFISIVDYSYKVQAFLFHCNAARSG